MVNRNTNRRNLETNVQSGDTQGLSTNEGADSESVEELVSEGQGFEANAIAGVEDGDDGEVREVTTHEVLQDDVPREYDDNPEDR